MEKSCGAIIIYNDTYLVLKYRYGHWGFVKGHIEADETPEETLIREVQEETGIKKKDLHIVKGFQDIISYFYNKEKKAVFKEVIYLLMECTTQDVTLSYEHTDFAWLSFSEALQRITFDNDKNVLKKAHIFLNPRQK